MASPNRAALIGRTIKVLRKHYKPVPPVKDRSLLEHLLFACLLEDSPHAAAEQVYATLKRDYFDWNEVRVSTIRELTEVLKPLVNPADAAARLKQTLHSVFESVYQFDIETLKKQNLGQSVKQLSKYNGSTPFVVAYVTQMSLGGHAIPINRGALVALHTVGVISDDEFAQGAVPGLERAVGKSKGVEVASLIHQMGVEVGRSPYGQTARKLLLEIDPHCKDRLPKRQAPKPAVDEPPPPPPNRLPRERPPPPRPQKNRRRNRWSRKAARVPRPRRRKSPRKSRPLPRRSHPKKQRSTAKNSQPNRARRPLAGWRNRSRGNGRQNYERKNGGRMTADGDD